ncbi:MAG TPA: hypothetical protein DD653_09580 [Marinilabiliales bacterium]|jgi:preprotein translocase subunit SecF|nr:MAG: hypothetical protein A2W84_06680 [Bacteroidetes bacterium GWC2_40_13]HBO74921.1 hypothetical protein [Marinilabiliales bacterium]
MKRLVLIFGFILGTLITFGQEKPKTQGTEKKEGAQTTVKEVPKASQNVAQIKKAQQQKQVKKAQLKQQRAVQAQERRKAIRRRINQ